MTSVSGRLRREDFEFEVSRGHKARPCLREGVGVERHLSG